MTHLNKKILDVISKENTELKVTTELKIELVHEIFKEITNTTKYNDTTNIEVVQTLINVSAYILRIQDELISLKELTQQLQVELIMIVLHLDTKKF